MATLPDGRRQETAALAGMNGEYEITTTQLPAFSSYMLIAKVGPMLVRAIGAMQQGDAAALGALFADTSPKLAEELALEILKQSAVHRTDSADAQVIPLMSRKQIDLAFGGDVKAMLLAMKQALEVNFAGFFAGGQRPAPTPAPETPTPAMSP